eukprot:3220704-Pyramimonas_sp.AAC.1
MSRSRESGINNKRGSTRPSDEKQSPGGSEHAPRWTNQTQEARVYSHDGPISGWVAKLVPASQEGRPNWGALFAPIYP